MFRKFRFRARAKYCPAGSMIPPHSLSAAYSYNWVTLVFFNGVILRIIENVMVRMASHFSSLHK